MEKPKHKADQKVGKVFLVFAGICILALPLVVFSAFSFEPKEMETAVIEAQSMDFDHNGKAIFENYDRISRDYIESTSTERTLSEYYSRRQYPGSPPEIPHPLEAHGIDLECLTCHANGGWTEPLKRITPLTPHPEQISCMQCHVWPVTDKLFREIDWKSVPPPRLGRAELPGAPVPIPHDLQMRGNCIACHVGPGTVTAIRVEHPSRGNCRQCHVPDTNVPLFERKSKPG
jgi:cytochrome c-type protein NapB